MRKIAHIINPVVVNEKSDLFVAQPVTFATMASARDFARGKVDVFLYTAQYPEDRPLVPADFQATPDFERSVLDLGSFRKKRKLPLIKDILDRLYQAAPEAEYLIYTNVDIALQPQFYVAVNTFIEEGHDGFVINRRTIGNYQSIEEIPLMYADPGESHPGWDCFVFKREAYPRFILGDICVGANLIGTVLLFNLLCTSRDFMEFKDKHLTFHLGDDRAWKSDKYTDYAAHNLRQTEKIISELKSVYGSIDGGGRYSYLFTFVDNLKKDMEKKERDKQVEMPVSAVDGKAAAIDRPHSLQRYDITQQSPGKGSRVLCITGMARSGTSMVARILNIMGLYLGPKESLILETDYNVKGCWEHKTLLEISDSIVNKLGFHGLLEPDWQNSTSLVGAEREAMAVIKKDFSGVQFWGWKDDRCSLTLPFWQKLLPEVECIICVRNPMDVAKSLLKQKWVSSLEEGSYRWLLLISSAIRNTQGRRRHIVFFEDFLGGDWKIALRELAEFLGPSYIDKLPEYEKEAAKFIRHDLRHHNTSMSDLMENPDICYAVKHFYFMLHNYVKGKSSCGTNEVGADQEQILQTFAFYAYSDALKMNHRSIRLTTKKEKLAAFSNSVEERDMSIKDLSNLLKERDMQIEAILNSLKDSDTRIEALLNSLSWKVTAPLRRAYELFNIDKKGSK